VYAARGEVEPFQIIVSAVGQALSSVNIALPSLSSSSGAQISSAQLTLYREYYTTVTTSSRDLQGTNRPLPPGKYADGLIPVVNAPSAEYIAFPFSVVEGRNQPLWIDIPLLLTKYT
jgi:hypothetical protein